MSSNLVDIRRGIEEARRVVAESRRFREGFGLALKRGVEPEAPLPRPRTYGEWKARKGARLAEGGAVMPRPVGVDGEVVTDPTPVWSEYVRREREAGRLPRKSVIERAREAGIPINGVKDFQNARKLFGGDAA